MYVYFIGFLLNHYHFITFIAIPDCIKVNGKRMLKENQTEPGVKSINWNNKQDSNNPSLLIRVCIKL